MNPLSMQALLSGNALFAVELITKSLLLFLACGGLLAAMRRSSAAARSMICVTAFVCMAILPVVQFSRYRVVVPFRYASTVQPIATARTAAAPPAVTTYSMSMQQPLAAITDQQAQTAHPTVSEPKRPLNLPELAAITPSAISATSILIHKRNGLFNTVTIIVAIWATGALLFLPRMLFGFVQIFKIRSNATTWIPGSEISAHIPEGTQVCMYSSTQPLCPMAFGWRSPTILLPTDASTWDTQRLKAAILHEAAHITRRDWPILTTVSMLCCLLWFHPLLWLLRSRLRIETEIACDECVLAQGMPGADYAGHLLAIAANCRSGISVSAGVALALTLTVSMAASKNSGKLEQRLLRLMGISGAPPRLNKLRASVGVLLFLASSFTLGLLHVDARADRPVVHNRYASIEKLPSVAPTHVTSAPALQSNTENDPNYQSAVSDLSRMPAVLTQAATQQSVSLPKAKRVQLLLPQITNPDSSGIAWGLPSASGLTAGLMSPAVGRSFHAGELISLEVYLKNTSSQSIQVGFRQRPEELNPNFYVVSGSLDYRINIPGPTVNIGEGIVRHDQKQTTFMLVYVLQPGQTVFAGTSRLGLLQAGPEQSGLDIGGCSQYVVASPGRYVLNQDVKVYIMGSIPSLLVKTGTIPVSISATGAVAWGSPTMGWQTGIRTAFSKQVFFEGEPVMLEYLLKRSQKAGTGSRVDTSAMLIHTPLQITTPSGELAIVNAQNLKVEPFILPSGKTLETVRSEEVAVGRFSLSAADMPGARLEPGQYRVKQSNSRPEDATVLEFEVRDNRQFARWGAPVNGIQVGVATVGGRDTFYSGDAIQVDIFLRNTTNETLKYSYLRQPGDYHALHISPEADPAHEFLPTGQPVEWSSPLGAPLTSGHGPAGMVKVAPLILQPGEIVKVCSCLAPSSDPGQPENVLEPHRYWRSHPGTYRLWTEDGMGHRVDEKAHRETIVRGRDGKEWLEPGFRMKTAPLTFKIVDRK